MGTYPFKGAFGGPPIFATINGVRHEIRYVMSSLKLVFSLITKIVIIADWVVLRQKLKLSLIHAMSC